MNGVSYSSYAQVHPRNPTVYPAALWANHGSNSSRSKTQADLRLWRQPWKRGPRKAYDSYPGTPATPDEDMSRGEMLMSSALEKLSRAAAAAATTSSSSTTSTSCSAASSPHYISFQDSYIISEHCYQKPRAYYPPAVEQRLVVETRQGSELEDSMRSTEDLLEREQRYGGLLDTHRTKAPPPATKVAPATLYYTDKDIYSHFVTTTEYKVNPMKSTLIPNSFFN